jgi:hypothetical protein
MSHVFYTFDSDNNGFLEAEEWMDFLTDVGADLDFTAVRQQDIIVLT